MNRTWISQIRTGLDTVRGAKGRSFWTMLGIIIGVASVISLVAIGEGIKNQVGGQIHNLGNNVIVVRTSQIGAGASSAANFSSLSGLSVSGLLTANDVKAVSQVNGVSNSAPLTLINGSVKGDGGRPYNDGYVIGTTPDLPGLINQSLAFGGFLNADTASNVAVLGQHAALKLFNEDVPLGHSFSFRGQTFVVVGIFNPFTTTPLSQQADFNNAIFIPNEEAESLSNNTAPTYEILARANDPSQTKAIASQIKTTLNSSHGGESGFSVLTGSQAEASSSSILDLLTKLIAGVAAISLLVAGLGIMNVMLVSVSERVREIGIRKAVGATNRQILSQFMIEAALLSLGGGLLGIVLAYLIDLGIRIATDLTPSIHWTIVVLATGVSILIGVIFGTVPAVKAARKDPIDALRAE